MAYQLYVCLPKLYMTLLTSSPWLINGFSSTEDATVSTLQQ